MTPLAQALSAALLHFVWLGVLVACILRTALFFLKRRSANARYLSSAAALAALVILPVLTTWILYRPDVPVPGAASYATTVWPRTAPQQQVLASRVAWLPALQTWALYLWSAGVLIFSLRLAWGCRQVATLRRSGAPAAEPILAIASALRARLGLRRTVSLVIVSHADGPSVVGWLRPAILLPAATLLGLTAQQLEAVLARELAHIRRHDYLVNLLQSLVETLLFYHPAVWWTSARMRHERELCCNDLAVHACGPPACYTRALTALVQPRQTSPSRWPALAALLLAAACLTLNINWARGQQQQVLPGEVTIDDPANQENDPGVQVDLAGATVVTQAGILYPASAWDNKIGGMVVVEVTLDGQGAVSDARVLSGPAELRKAVLQSILEWRFASAPGGSTRQVRIHFNWEQAPERPQRAPFTLFAADGVTIGHGLGIPPTADGIRNELVRAGLAAPEPAQLPVIEKRIDEAQKQALDQGRRIVFPAGTAGMKVTRISFSGVPEVEQQQLNGHLPVHLGDTLTPGQIEAIGHSIRPVNPSLIYMCILGGGDQAEIRILSVK